ncbi:MAG: hypothetical protein AAFP70_01605 [Calditrichota bacterium]
MQIQTNLRNHSILPESATDLTRLRKSKWDVPTGDTVESVSIYGKETLVRSGLTFTPYANPTHCNAHCRFCSEELLRIGQQYLTAQKTITDYDQYFTALQSVFREISGINRIGLSLSGLEATSDPKWLLRLLHMLSDSSSPQFDEKVLYTNSSGLYTHPELITALQTAGFDRLEISRCHYDESVNQRVMYINRNQPVYLNKAYEDLIRRILPYVRVKNSCILTQTGIHSIEEVETYLDWAMSLGVKQVVFRELSRLDDTYLPNRTKLWIDRNRVAIDDVFCEVMPTLGKQRSKWQYKNSRSGYYYYNEIFSYRREVEVILETSSYNALMAQNARGVIQKLVFHSNGNLCGDWDPENIVLGNYYS